MLNLFQQAEHAMLPKPTHEERARQDFVKSLRTYIQQELLPGLKPLRHQLDEAAARSGGPAPDRHTIRKAMVKEPYFQGYALASRTAQELLWHSVIDSIERDMDRLNEAAGALEARVGPAQVDPELEVPRYITALDIHCMPGGYVTEADPKGFAPGILYDRGVYLYSTGFGGPYNDDKGRSVCNYIKRRLDGFLPKRILDMGCTTGASTLPYKELFPEAEVWGIDVAAPLIRYAHLRAAALGSDVKFAQMNAENTSFEEGSFDLVVSHILLHETSGKAMPRIFEECHRLLRPGGYMIHADLPPFDTMDPFTQFILDNETYYNNEPFWGRMRELDQVDLARKAGFPEETIRFDTAPMAVLEFARQKAAGYDEAAAGAVADRKFEAGEYAPGGGWEVLIAQKAS